MPRILLVEDEPGIADAVTRALADAGHEVVHASDGAAALDRFRSGTFDLVLLDVMLPRIDGIEVCRRIRASSGVPILMLTARDTELDRVLGLEIGADDYVVKPFSARELVARIKALLRGRQLASTAPEQNARAPRQVFDVAIDADARSVRRGDVEIELSRREFDLLLVLVTHPRRVLTREWLMSEVWGRDFDGVDRTVDVHVMRLRDKLGRESPVAQAIVALRGVGYRFDAA